jgi:hypothetical protein
VKFEEAMALMRAGKKVRRKGWHQTITFGHLSRFSQDDIFAEDWEEVPQQKPISATIEWVPVAGAGRDDWSLFAWSDGVVTTSVDRLDAAFIRPSMMPTLTYVAKLQHPGKAA